MNQMSEWWDWKKSDRKLHLIIGDSLNSIVVKHVKDLLGQKKLDFLFIDGNHDPWWMFNDFITYGELVRYGGLIGFHDIRPEMHLQYVFDKIRGRTERYLMAQGIGIYWKEKLASKHRVDPTRTTGPTLPLIFRARDLPADHRDRAVLFDLDKSQSSRLKEIWDKIKFNGWKESTTHQ